jgi:glycosyltransferase involved in cell wall biosynthesis
MRISAIIPAFNCAAYLERAVESLLATGYPDLEIVVVDDGSRDDTWAVAKRLQDAHTGRLFAYQHPGKENRGVSATRNLGIARSTGELIALLDADDYVYPHRFTAALPALADPDVDAVYTTTEMVFASKDAEEAWLDRDRIFGLSEEVCREPLLRTLLQGRVWATSGILIRRTLLEQTGLFLASLPTAEDCHLWWRMATLGYIRAGDLLRPTGAYFRHHGNSFQMGLRARMTMLEALKDFRRWAIARNVDRAILNTLDGQIVSTSVRCYDAARLAGRYDVAWSVMRKLVAASPLRFGTRREVIRCVGSLTKRSAKQALGISSKATEKPTIREPNQITD